MIGHVPAESEDRRLTDWEGFYYVKENLYLQKNINVARIMHSFFTPGYPVSRGRNAVLYFWNVYVLCD